jgi:Fe-S oxidoreductase
MWMEESGDARINDTRFAEAEATGADTVATACPYCFVMLDDAAKAKGSDVRVADVATLLAESVFAEPSS